MTFKKKIASIIRYCPPLFKFGSKLYHKINGGFKSLSPGAPAAIEWAMEKTAEIHPDKGLGDYYEFGLYKGYTFLTAYRAAEKHGLTNKRFFGFDSFQGLPRVEGPDKTGGHFFEGQFACTKSEVKNNLLKHGVDFERIRLVKGFYKDSLTHDLKKELGKRPAGVVFLDCDLYSSTKSALEWLEGLIHANSIVIFDDWHSFTEGKNLGQQLALKEFMGRNPSLVFEPVFDYDGNGRAFIVTKK